LGFQFRRSFGVYNEINKFAPVCRDEVTVGC